MSECERCGRTFKNNIALGWHRRWVRFENEDYPNWNCIPRGPLSQSVRKYAYKSFPPTPPTPNQTPEEPKE